MCSLNIKSPTNIYTFSYYYLLIPSVYEFWLLYFTTSKSWLIWNLNIAK
jgi:hypothetical protein